MKTLAPWKRIQAFARTLGADVVSVNPWWVEEPNSLRARIRRWSKSVHLDPDVVHSPSDENLALHYADKCVFINADFTNHPETVGGLIHELGHVLAMREVTNRQSGQETDFLGWEWLVAKETDCLPQWRESMRNYAINDDGIEFGILTAEEQEDCLQTALIDGRRYGNVSPEGKPVSVR